MMERTLWFERQFRFDLPAGAFPAVLERLRGTPARLEEKMRSISAELRTKRRDGGWSIQEHAGHLLDLEELHESRIDDFLAGKQILHATDVSNKKTNLADHNSSDSEKLLRDFRDARSHFISRLQMIPDVTQSALHPRLNQPMRVIDLAVFVADHDDHHLASIQSLIEGC